MTMEPFITIQDLSHSFGTGALRKEILREVAADFYPGEIVIIRGPSGSGKTTLLTLVGALRTVQQGSIRIGGVELYRARPAQIMAVRRRIGFISQDHNLIASLSACENVQLALAMDPAATPAGSRKKAREHLAMVGLGEHGHKRPGEMSGGQKQRVAIARALIHRPDIIMADEPTAALDRETGREVVELLQTAARREGVAVLLVTHDDRILDIADRVITLEDGRLEETHRGMERLREELAALTGLLPRYAAAAAAAATESEGGREALRHRFRELREPLLPRTAAFSARRMSPVLMARARSLEKQLHDLALCEETLERLLTLLSAPPSGRMRSIGDTFFQPLEFLLATMAETGAASTAPEVELLLRLTEDRGEMMTSLRERYFSSESGLTGEEKRYLLAMTELFSRAVYLIRQWADSCRVWSDGRQPFSLTARML